MEDLSGKHFGRLTVIERDYEHGTHDTWWKCKCDCGNVISVRASHLIHEKCKSCGCLRIEMTIKSHTKHGMSCKSIHNVWMSMRGRCKNKGTPAYKDYGARGISVCPEWNDFSVFYKWALNNGYKEGLTIDRIDNNKNYEPSNCRWVDMKHQCWNRRNSYIIEYRNEKKSLAEWCDILNLSYPKTYQRINKLKWSAQRAFEL